jgi:hypothetical protein
MEGGEDECTPRDVEVSNVGWPALALDPILPVMRVPFAFDVVLLKPRHTMAEFLEGLL